VEKVHNSTYYKKLNGEDDNESPKTKTKKRRRTRKQSKRKRSLAISKQQSTKNNIIVIDELYGSTSK